MGIAWPTSISGKKCCIAVGLMLACCLASVGQLKLDIKGRFQKDSMLLGERMSFSLSCGHPANVEVFFPDKNYSFGSFKFIEKTYYPTKTKAKYSLDSAVYSLSSTEIDSIQYLKLPIFVKIKNDTLALFSNKDSVWLVNEIGSNYRPDLSLKPIALNTQNSYWPTLLKSLALAFLFFVWWQVFGNVVSRQITALFLARKHREFAKDFRKNMNSGKQDKIIEGIKMWKNYISKLQPVDLSALTSSEISQALPIQGLDEALTQVDQSIYGINDGQNLRQAQESLEAIASYYYNHRKQELLMPQSKNNG